MGKNSSGVRGGAKVLSEHTLFTRKLKQVESSIRYGTNETGVVIDTKGNVLVMNQGGRNYVKFSREDTAKMKDNVITHNHPSTIGAKSGSRSLGTTLSVDDLTTAVSANAREIRAVSPNGYTFSMKRPEGGWGVDRWKIASEYAKAKRKAKKKTDEYLRRVGWNQSSVDRANLMLSHDINRMLASKFGWIYKRYK